MAADDGGRLKCRLRMQATWTDDGCLEGTIEQKLWAVRASGTFEVKDCVELKPLDRPLSKWFTSRPLDDLAGYRVPARPAVACDYLVPGS